MKNLIIVLSVFLIAITSISAQTAAKKESPETIYICPTHPDKMNPSAGKCPKCGMALTKITEKVPTNATKGSQPMTKTVTKYVCPMDGSTSDKPGECSKCAMAMVKTTEKIDLHPQKGSQPTSKTVTKYVCSMDGTTSDKPGKCPKCGMEMTPEKDHKLEYSCPMHPKEMSDKSGKCPKCGMQMTPKASDKKEENHQH